MLAKRNEKLTELLAQAASREQAAEAAFAAERLARNREAYETRKAATSRIESLEAELAGKESELEFWVGSDGSHVRSSPSPTPCAATVDSPLCLRTACINSAPHFTCM